MNWLQRALQVGYKFLKGALVGAVGGVSLAASTGAPLGKSALIAAAVGGAGHAIFNLAEQQGGNTAVAAGLVQAAAPIAVTLTDGHIKQIAQAVADASKPNPPTIAQA